MTLKRITDSAKRLVGAMQKPHPVFGSEVSKDSFLWSNISQILHYRESENASIGVFELDDGRFASVTCQNDSLFCIGDLLLDERMAHVANSYDSIINLGLTDEFREILGL